MTVLLRLVTLSIGGLAALIITSGCTCRTRPAEDGLDASADAGSPSDAQACGNGDIEGGEQCDGANIGTATCASLGFEPGLLSCTAMCQFDITSCEPIDSNAYALQFDGFGDVVDCGYMPLALPLYGYTLEFWAKPAAGAQGSVFQKWTWGPEPGSIIAHFYNWSGFPWCTDNTPCWSAWADHQGPAIGTESFAVTSSVWHHAAVTFEVSTDGTAATLTTMTDGVVLTSFTTGGLTTPLNATPLDVLIGNGVAPDASGGPWPYEGLIDEIRFWSYARSVEEIQAAMYSTVAPTEPGLVAYWPFDEGTGQITTDIVTGTTCRLGAIDTPDADDPVWTMDTAF